MPLVGINPLTAAVGSLYNSFPYPAYPLFLPLRWQDGYLGASRFAQALCGSPEPAASRNEILLAGCGETQPYIMRQWEPRRHQLTAVDLSLRSIQRARWRLWRPGQGRTLWHCAALEDYLEASEPRFSHADAFGVLHHLADPAAGLQLLSESLLPGGTLRLMVYNAPARQWLYHLKHALNDLGLDAYKKADRAAARTLLSLWMQESPALQQRLRALGAETLSNDARLVDTFFHPREARLSFRRWFDCFAAAGLEPVALFDRYGELDHLANPLWQMPRCDELSMAAESGSYCGNLEIWLRHGQGSSPLKRKPRPAFALRMRLLCAQPPARWFSFAETTTISLALRLRLWQRLVNLLTGYGPYLLGSLGQQLSQQALARLCRLGAVLPQQIEDKGLRAALSLPLTQDSSSYDWGAARTITGSQTAHWVATRIATEQLSQPERRRQAVLARLERAQGADLPLGGRE